MFFFCGFLLNIFMIKANRQIHIWHGLGRVWKMCFAASDANASRWQHSSDEINQLFVLATGRGCQVGSRNTFHDAHQEEQIEEEKRRSWGNGRCWWASSAKPLLFPISAVVNVTLIYFQEMPESPQNPATPELEKTTGIESSDEEQGCSSRSRRSKVMKDESNPIKISPFVDMSFWRRFVSFQWSYH